MTLDNGAPRPTRVLGYGRVSTIRQQVVGMSLEAQRSAVQAECANRGWELLSMGSDAMSGGRADNRPMLRSALVTLEAGGADVLMVAKLDRLARSAKDFYDLVAVAERAGWQLVVLDPPIDMASPFGRAMAGMAAVFAELERDLIGQRTRAAIAERKEAGVYKGGRATRQGRPVAADTLNTIMAQHHAGNGSVKIARVLEQMRVRAPRGGKTWNPRTIRRIVERELQRLEAEREQSAPGALPPG